MRVFGECHAHLFMNGRDYRLAVETHRNGPDEAAVRRELEEYRKRGVTFIRDGGDHFGVSLLARRLAPEYGIRLITPGFALYKSGCYGKVVGLPFENLREYAVLVRRVKQEGGDFVKIMTTGILDFQTENGLTGVPLKPGEVREMVRIAHEEGLRVMSHTNGAREAEAAADAGVDSLEHGNLQDRDSLSALAERRVVWVPTLVTVRNLMGRGRFSDEVLKKIWEGVKKNVRLGRKLGVAMAPGSDAGAFGVLHGQGIEEEYSAFREIFPEDDSLDLFLAEGEEKIRRFDRPV
jgi:hypothetical protein